MNLPNASGISLKPQHYDAVLSGESPPGRPDWVEVHPQNYFCDGGMPHRWLTAIAEILPLSFHSVGLSLGSADGLNEGDLEKLALLCQRYNPASVSDHISFSGNASDRFADLLPIPYTHEMLDHFAVQVDRVQDRLQRTIVLENPSRFLAFQGDEMDEVAFIAALIKRTGCGLLFDINNVEVSATNLGHNAAAYVDAINPDWVSEIHLAGHAVESHDSGALLIDDHGSPVTDATWALYERFIARAGAKPTLIEWDTDVPAYGVLMAEAGKADAILNHALNLRHSVIASEARQSSVARLDSGLPRFARNDDLYNQDDVLKYAGLSTQTNFITTINKGPAALDPNLFAGNRDRILLGLKAHANTISHARLVALEATFPLTNAAMGAESFNTVSRQFCETAEARACDVALIGAGFAGYLAGHAATDIIDLARIEWAWLESYHSADAGAMALADLAKLDEAALLSLNITAHPAARIVGLGSQDFNLIPELGDVTDAVSILITRPDNEVRLLPLDTVSAKIFATAQNGTQMCNLLEIATEYNDEAEPLAPIIALIGAGALIETGDIRDSNHRPL